MAEPKRDYRWRVRFARNPWFSLGLHVDHHDPFVSLHLPGVIVTVGRICGPVLITKCPCGRRDSWTWDWADGTPPSEASSG